MNSIRLVSSIQRGIDRAPFTPGTKVRAIEMCDPEEQDHEPRMMEGVLVARWIAVFGALQYTVDGVPIEPSTIEVLEP